MLSSSYISRLHYVMNCIYLNSPWIAVIFLLDIVRNVYCVRLSYITVYLLILVLETFFLHRDKNVSVRVVKRDKRNWYESAESALLCIKIYFGVFTVNILYPIILFKNHIPELPLRNISEKLKSTQEVEIDWNTNKTISIILQHTT